MPVEVVWLDQAVDDLDAVFMFIAKDNPTAALHYIDGLEDICTRLRISLTLAASTPLSIER